MNNETEKIIAQEAIAAFCKTTGLKGKYAKGYFILDHCKKKLKLKLVIAAQVIDNVGIGILKQEDNIENCIIAARHIYPGKALLLKQLGIPFMDMAGNAFINKPPMYIYIQGQQPVVKNATKPVRAFKKTGLKIIFAFLCNPGLENKTYRDIAGNAGVALGAVGRIMKELLDKGYLKRKGKQDFKLTNREDLFKRWVTAYPEQLRPGLLLGKYMFPDIRLYAGKKNIQRTDIAWGGELAAEKLTGYLIAKNATLYIKGNIDELALKLRLKKDADGNLEILKCFWNFENMNQKQTVPAILVYADLLATGLERNIETAGNIYEKEIKKFLA